MNITWGLILTRDKASVLVGERVYIHIFMFCLINLFRIQGRTPEYTPP